jgi:hypothetical protein
MREILADIDKMKALKKATAAENTPESRKRSLGARSLHTLNDV